MVISKVVLAEENAEDAVFDIGGDGISLLRVFVINKNLLGLYSTMIVYLVAKLIDGKTEFRLGHCFVEMQLSLVAVLINV